MEYYSLPIVRASPGNEGVSMSEPEPETAEERMVSEFLVFAKYIALCLLVAGGVVGSGVLGITI